MKRLAILFSRFGPYHLARLEAAGTHLAAESWSVLGIEAADQDRENPWDTPGGAHAFERRTLFPGADYPGLSRQTLAAAVDQALDAAAPAVVAIPGWRQPEALAALRWCRRQGRPAVLMSESARDDEDRRPWREAIKGRLVRQCAAALVGGRRHAAYAEALGMPADHIFMGYDAVDNAHFAQGADTARAAADATRSRLRLPPRYAIASCRFIPKKNVDGLLEAFARYRRSAPAGEAWDLVLCGDGPLRPSLEARVRTLGLADAVHFPGFAGYADLPAYYGLAEIFVHASRVEQWGLVVNEALAAGLPVLVSRACGCVSELVEDGVNGHRFDPEDVEALAAHLSQMAAAPASARAAMGAAGRARAAHWGPARFADGLARALTIAGAAPPRPYAPLDALILNLMLR